MNDIFLVETLMVFSVALNIKTRINSDSLTLLNFLENNVEDMPFSPLN
jgi:hypothetical protein